MLQDISADYDNTWQFLERRIEDASKIQDVIAKTDGATQNIQQTFGAVFTTVIEEKIFNKFYKYFI